MVIFGNDQYLEFGVDVSAVAVEGNKDDDK